MNRHGVILLVLLGLLVVALFFASVALGSERGEADPRRAGGVALLDDLLGAVPGLVQELEADDVDASCFDGTAFVVPAGPAATCAVAVPSSVDRVELRVEGGACPVHVRQRGVPRRRADARDGSIRISLSDTPAVLELGPGPCRLVLG